MRKYIFLGYRELMGNRDVEKNGSFMAHNAFLLEKEETNPFIDGRCSDEKTGQRNKGY